MKALLFNPGTASELEAYLRAPAHALMLTGLTGSGKRSVAIWVGSLLLGVDDTAFEAHPYSHLITSTEGTKAIGIETVRELEHVLSLKVPNKQAVNRVIIIENAHLLTVEAQNALLKTIEEPPEGTVIIMSAINLQSLLPTIRSRAQHIAVKRLDATQLEHYFSGQGYDSVTVKRALAMSGGLVGLTQALLGESDHPLLQAAGKARELLGLSTFERLTRIDELAQTKSLSIDTLFMMQQMALISLRTSNGQAAVRWQRILQATHEAIEALRSSAQTKLVLANFFLSL